MLAAPAALVAVTTTTFMDAAVAPMAADAAACTGRYHCHRNWQGLSLPDATVAIPAIIIMVACTAAPVALTAAVITATVIAPVATLAAPAALVAVTASTTRDAVVAPIAADAAACSGHYHSHRTWPGLHPHDAAAAKRATLSPVASTDVVAANLYPASGILCCFPPCLRLPLLPSLPPLHSPLLPSLLLPHTSTDAIGAGCGGHGGV
jgi:hypothetical protein